MSLADVRTALAQAFTGVTANVYAFPPATVVPPAVIVVPDEPYLELVAINSSTRIRSRYRVTVAVAPLDNQATLDQLEQLCVAVYGALPSGATAGSFSRPSMTQVGPSDLLVSDLSVTVISNQAAPEEE